MYLYTIYKNGVMIAENVRQTKAMELTGMKSSGSLHYVCDKEILFKGVFKIEQYDDEEIPVCRLKEWDECRLMLRRKFGKERLRKIVLIREERDEIR